MQIDPKRLEEIETIVLRSGKGEDLEHACVMQAVDYIATGGLSDHPECACPALTAFAIRLNEQADKETRQRLKPFIPKLVGTRDGKTKARAEFLAHHSITAVLPILVEAADLKEDAEKLRAFKFGEWQEKRAFLLELRPRLKEAVKKKAAYADAAYVAAAYADAAYAYADAAYAYAYAADKAFWLGIKGKIWDAAFDGFRQAVEL